MTTSRTRSRAWSTSTCSSRPPPTGTASTTCSRSTPWSARRRRSREAARDEAVSRLLRLVPGHRARPRRTRSRRSDTRCRASRPLPGYPPLAFASHGSRAGLVRRRAREHRRGDPAGGGRRPARGRLAAAAGAVPAVQPPQQLGGLRDHPPRRGGERGEGTATGSARPGRSTSSATRWPACAIRRRFAHLERALAVRQEFGDTRGEAQTAIALGEGHLRMPRAGRGRAAVPAARGDLLEPTGASSLRSVALNNLGEVYFGLGDLDAAAECYLQALDIGREIGGHAEGHALQQSRARLPAPASSR